VLAYFTCLYASSCSSDITGLLTMPIADFHASWHSTRIWQIVVNTCTTVFCLCVLNLGSIRKCRLIAKFQLSFRNSQDRWVIAMSEFNGKLSEIAVSAHAQWKYNKKYCYRPLWPPIAEISVPGRKSGSLNPWLSKCWICKLQCIAVATCSSFVFVLGYFLVLHDLIVFSSPGWANSITG